MAAVIDNTIIGSKEYIELENSYGAHNYSPLDVVIDHGQGVWVTDVDGRRYLDCLAAYSALNQGHCHPRILRALIKQAHKLTLTSRAFRNEQLPLLLEELHSLTGFEMALLMNSGVEAVETALKTARRWGYRVKEIPHDQAEIIVCANNFHGRTISVISFSTEEQYRAGFGPFTPGFKVIPFGDAAALEQAITPHTCAFLCEPIQGEAGILLPPPGYLALAAKICHENNVLFMLDEIQSGLGRTGKMFAYQYEEATPDILIIGKALAGGFYPVSGILSSRSILELFGPGDHGSTFGGNPLGCAVAREALKVIVDEKLCERSFTLGAYFMQRLRKLRNPVIREVRGKGLWIGIELTVPARPYCERLRELGVLCKETHEKVIRIAPPLVITQDEAGWACDRFLQVFGESDR